MINKIDRPDGRPDAVVDEGTDLFALLDANDEQLDFPILYGRPAGHAVLVHPRT